MSGEAHLVTLLQLISKTYLLNTYCLAVFFEKPLDMTIFDLPSMNFGTKITPKNIFDSLEAGCTDYMVRVENVTDFLEKFDDNVLLSEQRHSDRKLILIPFKINARSRKTLIDVLDNKALNFIPNILLVIPNCKIYLEDDCCDSYELVTNKYFGAMGNKSMVSLDIWNGNNNSFSRNMNLFPDKFSNMEGGILKLTTFEYDPYIYIKTDDKDNIILLDGIDILVFVEFCKKHNCTLSIINDNVNEWGNITGRKSGFGLFGNIVMDKADIGHAALFGWYNTFKYFDYTRPGVIVRVTCLVPLQGLVASWLLPILPFEITTWVSVFITFIVGASGLYITAQLVRKKLSIVESFLMALAIIMQQSLSTTNFHRAIRCVMFWLLMFSIIIINTYSGGLSSSVTVSKYKPPIDTVARLAESNLAWGASQDAWKYSIEMAKDPDLVKLLKTHKSYDRPALSAKGKTKDYAFAIERLHGGHFAIGNHVTEEFIGDYQIMTEDIYFEHSVFMLRKSSPFTKKINVLIAKLMQFGLPIAWESQVITKYANYKIQTAVKTSTHREDGEPKPLKMAHFQGAIFLWCLGMTTALIAFIGETVPFKFIQAKFIQIKTFIMQNNL